MELYYHSTDRDILVLSADGGLDSTNAEKFLAELRKAVEAGARKLIVDCTRLHFISSYGVAVLVRLHKTMADVGGDVKVAALDSRVTRIVTLVGLEKVFDLYATVDDARDAFRA